MRKDQIAAVLILIIEKDGKEVVLLTKRNSKMRSHPGQICFPGGKFDESMDNNIIDTALREAREEIGLIECEVLHILQPCVSAHGLLVYPVLAKCLLFEPILNPAEVELVYYFEFQLFLDPLKYDHSDWDMATSKFYKERIKYIDLKQNTTILRLHQFEINTIDTVWGLTSEFALHAASFYYSRGPKFVRMSPDQTLFWWQITEILFTSL